jgi:hypothetical protein
MDKPFLWGAPPVTLAAPVNRIRLLLTPDSPAEPPRDTTPPVASDPPPDPVESAKARAEAFDAALAYAVRILHDLLHSQSVPTRLAAANAIVNLKKASLRHNRPVFEVADDSFLPPLLPPDEAAGETEADGKGDVEDEVAEPPPVESGSPSAVAGSPDTATGHSAVAGSPDPVTGPDRRSPVFEEETSGRRRWHGQETVPRQGKPGRKPRGKVPCTAGIVGLTPDEFRRGAAELGLERWERLCERVAGRFTWPQLLRLAARAEKKAKRKQDRRPAKSQPVKRSEYRDVPITSDWPPDPPAPPTPTNEEKTWSPEELGEVEEPIRPPRIGWESRFDHCQALTFFSPG